MSVDLPPLPSVPVAPSLARGPRPGWTDRAIQSPSSDVDHEEGKAEDKRRFPCPHCGGDSEYYIGHRQLRCRFCGATQEIPLDDRKIEENSFHAALQLLRSTQAARNAHQGREQTLVEGAAIRCDSCGAAVIFPENVTSTDCAYCGEPVQRERLVEGRLPIDAVLPFGVDGQQARSNLRRWMSRLWFAPGSFKRDATLDKLHGIYLPYWTFDAMTFTRYQGQRGDNYTVTVGSGKNQRQEVRTRWQPASGKFQRFFDDVLTVATRNIPIQLLRKLEPWPLERLEAFRHEYLTGFEARTYDIEPEDALVSGKGKMDSALRWEAAKRIGGDQQRIQSLETRYDAITYKLLLLPLWMMSYRYGPKTFQVVVNATTGEVFGERPWSVGKIVLAVLLGLVLVLILAALF